MLWTTIISSKITEYDSFGPQPPRKAPGEVMGVQINSDGEMKLHGKPRCEPVGIPREHLLRATQSDLILKPPISSKVGLPLCLWMEKGPILTGAPEAMNFEGVPCDFYDNQAVTFLMTETDPKKPNWGWSSIPPLTDAGNVIAMRENEEDITVEEVEALCDFSENVMGPIF